jgi:NAD(P)-dependent dehydrogenase (short-subunit alcohol dehydrogenase family)
MSRSVKEKATMWCRRLEGRSALITGAASGVGRATAKRFADEGATVLCLFDRDTDNLKEAVREVEAAGARALPFVGDVTSAESCQEAADQLISAAGRMDILVSNVGADQVVPFLEMSVADWDRVVGINLRASFILGQIAARAMVADGRGGVILYTASICALGASAEDAHYGASKAGIVNLAKTMAIELVSRGVRVNTVSPGPLDTPMSLALLGSEEAMQSAREDWPLVPMRRLGKPEEIAASFAYLASDDASYVTGHNLVVDGGLTAQAYSIPDELIAP